jgi:hypothetical protein
MRGFKGVAVNSATVLSNYSMSKAYKKTGLRGCTLFQLKYEVFVFSYHPPLLQSILHLKFCLVSVSGLFDRFYFHEQMI